MWVGFFVGSRGNKMSRAERDVMHGGCDKTFGPRSEDPAPEGVSQAEWSRKTAQEKAAWMVAAASNGKMKVATEKDVRQYSSWVVPGRTLVRTEA